MVWVKINEYKHFVLYENEKTGVREAFLYTDLNNRKPEKIETNRRGVAGRDSNKIKLEEVQDETENKEGNHKQN